MRGLAVSIIACLPFVIASPASASMIVESTFDSDNEGWTSFQNGGAAVEFSATGGNPDGHVSVEDLIGLWAYLRGPAKFRVPAQYDGELSFDLRHEFDSLEVNTAVRAALVGDGLILINQAVFPTDAWENYSFMLSESAGWLVFPSLDQAFDDTLPVPSQAQMKSVLLNLEELYILSDYTNGNRANGRIDQTFIDNVRFTVAEVPEPLGMLFLAKGIAVLLAAGWLRDRRTGLG